MADAPDVRICVNGLRAETPVKVPGESEFFRSTLLESPDLKAIVDALIRKADRGLGDVLAAEVELRVCWRKKASSTRGRRNLCTIQRASADLKHYTGADYILKVSADLAREYGLTHWQLEAALYSKLLEVAVEVDSEGETNLKMRAPDFVGFHDELRHYGLWSAPLAASRAVFTQAKLFGDVEQTFARQRAANDPDRKAEKPAATNGTPAPDPEELPKKRNTRQTRQNGTSAE